MSQLAASNSSLKLSLLKWLTAYIDKHAYNLEKFFKQPL